MLPDTLTITITQEHIDEGVKGNCELCPTALAVTKLLGELIDPDTGELYISALIRDAQSTIRVATSYTTIARFNMDTLVHDDVRVYYHSAQLSEWIEQFDAGDEMLPLTTTMGTIKDIAQGGCTP